MRSRIMSKHAYLTNPIAIALLIVCPSLTRAQAQPAITVQFQDASLAQVAQAFASLSGLTIVVAADVSDLKVTTAVKNVEWPRALGQILEAHDVVARLDASGVFRSIEACDHVMRFEDLTQRMTWSHASMLRASSVSKGARSIE